MQQTYIDVVICLGGYIYEDGTPTKNVQDRAILALKLARKNNCPLVITGGKHHARKEKQSISEARSILKFLENNYDLDDLNMFLEEKGNSTVHQLCILKNDIVTQNNWKNIGVVTDEVHSERAEFVAKWVLGKQFRVQVFNSKVLGSEESVESYKNREKIKLKLAKKHYKKFLEFGNDKNILNFQNHYAKLMKKHIKKGGKPTDVIKITGYSKER